MRLGLLTAMAVLTLGVPLEAARAGGVVIDFRETGWSSEDSTSTETSRENFPVGTPATPKPAAKPTQAAPPTTTTAQPTVPANDPIENTSNLQEATKVLSPNDLRDLEIQLMIESGLLSEEEAASGCGGASSAQGPLGLVSLLVASLPLFRRRRK